MKTKSFASSRPASVLAAWAVCVAWMWSVPAHADDAVVAAGGAGGPIAVATSFDAPRVVAIDRPLLASSFALPTTEPLEMIVVLADGDEKPKRRSRSMLGRNDALKGLLTPERARVLLQSLTVPGWGQATAGAKGSSKAFLVAEAGVWGSFTAFRIQQAMRRQSYEKTARLFAGIDLDDRDDEFRRIIGNFLSSEDYNRLVVRRDAANQFYGDPAAYDAYIREHELHGADAWNWESPEAFLRYIDQRKDTQRAGLRANTALALAVANRIISAIHAARVSRPAPEPKSTSWNLECVPTGDGDPTAFRLAVRTSF